MNPIKELRESILRLVNEPDIGKRAEIAADALDTLDNLHPMPKPTEANRAPLVP